MKFYVFLEDQIGERKAKCLGEVLPLSSADERFRRQWKIVQDDDTNTTAEQIGFHSTDAESVESVSSGHHSTFMEDAQSANQNRVTWTNLARACKRYNLLDRAGAAVATCALQDIGMIDQENNTFVIDLSKLRREREQCRKEIQEKEMENFKLINGLYFDGRKDATLMMAKAPTGKSFITTELEEHYVLVGEPGGYYLTHLSPPNGKGRVLAKEIFDSISDTELCRNLMILGSDGTASMTGRFNDCIRAMEELVQKPLQWAICLLHTNELPLHVFTKLDGTTKSPDSFSGPIGSKLDGSVSEWPVVQFKRIINPNFPELPQCIVDDLDTDQKYAYQMCTAIMIGSVEPDLQYLEVGPIVHSRGLTLACRILRFYVSQSKPSTNLKHLVQFCMEVYFPSWFEIKRKHTIVDGAKNFFNIVNHVTKLPNAQICTVALNVLQRNAYFVHPKMFYWEC